MLQRLPQTAGLGILKSVYRNLVRRKLSAIPGEIKRKWDQQIFHQVISHPKVLRASSIICYVSLPNEVDTWAMIGWLIQQGKKVWVPRVSQDGKRMEIYPLRAIDRLAQGYAGIWEPEQKPVKKLNKQSIQMIIVPGVAFDSRGARLGRGGGHFDRFLSQYPSLYKLGLAYQPQIFSSLPQGQYDISMDEVIIGGKS